MGEGRNEGDTTFRWVSEHRGKRHANRELNFVDELVDTVVDEHLHDAFPVG